MPNFPDSFFSPREVANREGVEYDVDKSKVFFAEDHNNLSAELVAVEGALGLNPEGDYTTVADRLESISPLGLTRPYNYNAYFGHASAQTTYFNILAGGNNVRAIVDAFMNWNNGDGYRVKRFYVFCNYNNATQYIHTLDDDGTTYDLITCTYSGGYFRLGFQTTRAENGYLMFNVLANDESKLVIQ